MDNVDKLSTIFVDNLFSSKVHLCNVDNFLIKGMLNGSFTHMQRGYPQFLGVYPPLPPLRPVQKSSPGVLYMWIMWISYPQKLWITCNQFISIYDNDNITIIFVPIFLFDA